MAAYGRHKKKNPVPAVIVAALAAICCIGGIFAYYTGKQKVTNTITAGNTTTEIVEKFDPVPDKNVYKKAVRIENTGEVSCYVRVYAAFSDEEIRDISEISADGSLYYKASEYRDHLPDGWKAGKDGYLYYTKALKPGEKTAYLMKNVETTWKADMDQRDFDLIIRQEAVQVPAGHKDADHTAAWTVFGEEVN